MANDKTAIIISYADLEGNRLPITEEFLKSKGYDVTLLCSDFNHRKKVHFVSAIPNAVQVPVRCYKKNFSIARILSCKDFARETVHYLEALPKEPDLVIVKTPPNYLFPFFAGFKARHNSVKVIFDIFDLWPETFPLGNVKPLLKIPFAYWAKLRTQNIASADFVITECNLFRDTLSRAVKNIETIYLCEAPIPGRILEEPSEGSVFEVCYLGQINNVIDIDGIASFLGKLENALWEKEKPQKIRVHVIGTGERTDEFLGKLKAANLEVDFHGAVYDNDKKLAITKNCRFGINMVTESSFIGLTMKSVDYLNLGIPLLSNVPADTKEIIEKEHCGIHVEHGDAGSEAAVAQITGLSPADYRVMKENAVKAFDKYFNSTVVLDQYDNILGKFC